MNLKYLFILLTMLMAMPVDIKMQSDEFYKPEYIKNISKLKLDSQAFEQTIIPEDYIVGPGDIFDFNMISTSRTVSVNLSVSPSGHILIPVIGSIYIDGLTLLSATEKMEAACIEKYPNADIFINLNKVRQFIVNVTGAIGIHIGRVTATPIHRVSDIYSIVNSQLDLELNSDIDEINKMSNDSKLNNEKEKRKLSLRNINLVRDGVNESVDLLSYFILGDNENNPYLQTGDRLEFSFQDGIIVINGGISVPGEYEFLPGNNLNSYIDLAGGLTRDSDISLINITRIEKDNLRKEINFSDYEKALAFIIDENDHIFIRKKQNYKKQDIVVISGEIQYPGSYTFNHGSTTVGEILKKCGGLTEKGDNSQIVINNELIASTEDIELNRILQIPAENRNTVENSYIKARNGISKGMISSSSPKFTESILNFKLSSGDHIIIPERLDYVEVIGAVVHPGRYPYISDNTFENYIELAGGLENNSTRKRYIIKASTGQRMPVSRSITIDSGDVIFIAEKLEYNTWDRLKESIAMVSQVATTIIVIQNLLGN